MDNRMIAQQLMRHARYLGDQHASLYRARAYRLAAETVLGLDEPIEQIVNASGRRGLLSLPGVGAHIAQTLETLVRTGALPTLNKDGLKSHGKRGDPKSLGERSESWRTGESGTEQPCGNFSTSCP